MGETTKSSHGYGRSISLSVTPHRSPITYPSSTVSRYPDLPPAWVAYNNSGWALTVVHTD
ncbi:hypothetical protein L3i22_052730 [Actinoplanes sp. L3-i22]|nr:hypothetical protein L3i22_052730 [Actinoplanes sp. L3-i22]